MAGATRVFICYKKLLAYEESGQRVVQKNTAAETLHFVLAQDPGYDPWVDNARIVPGMAWETEIYQRILSSDVLLVLIGRGTAESEWVRREVAMATALGLSIVPVGFDMTDRQMADETTALNIGHLQWVLLRDISPARAQPLLAELRDPLARAAAATVEQQRLTLAPLLARQRAVRTPALDRQRAASFDLYPATGMRLHVAAGDIEKVRNVDVFVNPENDYMQMARFFESRTISSILRRRGQADRRQGYHDTIQQELDWQLRDRSRPVQASEVFPTSAGGPRSDLARINRGRVILHVAAVQAVAAESRVIPYKHPRQIESSVRSVLAAMGDLIRTSCVISPDGTDQRADQERLAAAGGGGVESVIFPLLGTGQGGADTAEVVGPMIDGMLGFLSEEDDGTVADALRDVYIAALYQEDVDIVTEVLGSRLGS
ncbi:TIR domain-containing protein [Spongiactinospora sp. TRM90649]|uniref:TIR domain-containing protein n=1 Tax=Spongiactinospora sp. TRM90649 TaxID=3031114 RepID=UPI0023F785C9|nr:TIR domain-containing protein [Spongiactinospora sp. TRM90649]MDF5755931.1 TIR domain-containing protein [Spongiactinospora sp. TRM90649]